MGSHFRRALQLAVLLGIIALGAIIRNEAAGDAIVGAGVLGLMALGAIGFGLSEFSTSAAVQNSATPSRDDLQATLRPAGQRLAKELAQIVRVLESYLRANSGFSNSLSRANRDLPLLERPEQVRAVVVSLIEENKTIQARADELSRNMEESVAQIDGLRAELAEANERALRDPVTALRNRHFFEQKLHQALIEARAELRELCLLVCDLDFFKAINDKFGHPVGDKVLTQFSKIMSESVRGEDTVARIGGDEFAIIFPNSKLDDAARIAEQIRRQLQDKKWLLGSSGAALGTVTASFGIAALRAEEWAEGFVKRADDALYRAKSEGRNRVVVESQA
ncbi:MAG: GGDEF domain-containing protein [Candidatus Pacebacteria bacterium]|nr:GGDEF domain-containing protein [Candidatus Paceibacterota bacterium]